jgi:hypothetical protein
MANKYKRTKKCKITPEVATPLHSVAAKLMEPADPAKECWKDKLSSFLGWGKGRDKTTQSLSE